jgi:uncharacterized protein YndB with AHSA1/START domain
VNQPQPPQPPSPTGQLRGDDLVLTRRFHAAIDDVWTSVTASASTARWYGPWERVGTDDREIRIQMAFEDGKPWTQGVIERCEPPHELCVRTRSTYGEKRLSMSLRESAGVTTLEFVHHHINKNAIGELGAGWEYYLDMLVAAREQRTLPNFNDYYPSQKSYFTSLV